MLASALLSIRLDCNPRLFCQERGHSDQLYDLIAEIPEARISGLPAMITIVDLLQNHSQFEDAQYFVISDIASVAPSLTCIAFNKLIASVPARFGCDGRDPGDLLGCSRSPGPVA